MSLPQGHSAVLETILCFSYTRFNSSPTMLVVGIGVNVRMLGVDLVTEGSKDIVGR